MTFIEVKEKYAVDYEKEIGEEQIKNHINPLIEKYLKPFEKKDEVTGTIKYSENYNTDS